MSGALRREVTMIAAEPLSEHLGATLYGFDLSKPLGEHDVGTILDAIARFGLVRFPGQTLDPAAQRAFAARFGHVPAIRGRLAGLTPPGAPEINILSNIVENGRNIGATDAGVIWHTDMVHNSPPGFANVLYALKVPRRDGRALGGTEFYDLQLAWDTLPGDVKARLGGVMGLYTGESYNSVERAPFDYGTNSHKAGKKPPVRHPAAFPHPVSGRIALYCDPGHIDALEGLPEGEAGDMLDYLLRHIMQPRHHFVFNWTEGDVMMWDNLRTVHHAVQDFEPHEHRLIWRCQIEGDKVFDRDFVARALQRAA
jgi:taurine dioxygenase